MRYEDYYKNIKTERFPELEKIGKDLMLTVIKQEQRKVFSNYVIEDITKLTAKLNEENIFYNKTCFA